MVQWTESQQQAIDARNSNLLVAAAAGSGKTAVLVERIIQMILKDKIDLDSLLIVTFTNAAAGEMRERIAAAILKELEKKNENEVHLRRQMNLLSRASISTLHAFCIEVARKYFHMIDIDPNFRIGDGTETGIMKLEVVEELFESEYEKSTDEFLGLVERFGDTKQDLPLQDIVLRLYDFIQSKPDPLLWLKERIEDFRMDLAEFEKSPWYGAIAEQIDIELKGALDSFEEAKSLCERECGPRGYREAIVEDIQLTEALQKDLKKGMKSFYNQISMLDHKRLGKLDKNVDEGLKEEVKTLRDKGKKILQDIQKGLFGKNPEAAIEDLHALYPYMRYLYQLICAFDESYQEKKKEKGIVDFNDLEHYALAILKHESAAQAYRNKFAYIFVDEYQDSNIVQETLIGFIKRENNLFLVGDVKQSIYRFRLADPSLFIEKYETYTNEVNVGDRRIDLSQNFRSREEILEGVNGIFRQIMSKAFGEIDYDDKACLYKGADREDPVGTPLELILIEKKEIEEELSSDEKEEIELLEEQEILEDTALEAKIAAQKIKELLQGEIYDPKMDCYRPVTYRDIVILLRTTKNWADTFQEVFMAEGIPAYADVNAGYFETIEVNIFIHLLQLIDNKQQDIPLLSVMRSPIGGFKTEDLISIRLHNKSETFYNAVETYCMEENNELADRLKKFIGQINGWKEESRYINMDTFIWKLLMETGYYHYVGAMPGGMQRQANLRILFDRARQFQKTSIRGLFNFIRFIDKLKSSSGDMGTAKILGENDNLVRIMSIHKSKGLEFPIVMVAGMGKQFNLMDTNQQILFHKDLGIGSKYADPELRHYSDTIVKVAMKNKIRLESLSEEMRILYVALTRPKDKLVLIGAVKELEKAAKRWMRPLNPYHLSKGKSYLDWIGSVLIRHRDGCILRDLARIPENDASCRTDEGQWVIHTVRRQDTRQEQTEQKEIKQKMLQYLKNFQREEASLYRDMIYQRLNWFYENQVASQIPSKLSVTEIKRLTIRDRNPLGFFIPPLQKMPGFMEGKKQFSAVEKGTIIHFVMQHLRFQDLDQKERIQEQVEDMVARELLTPEEAAVVDIDKIFAFFQSSIGKRILSAKYIFRETAFNYMKPAQQLNIGLENCDEGLLVQGVIDCYFEEDEAYVLVDYKTDIIGMEGKEEILEKYRVQIELYKEALEKISGKSVRESYLYLFHLDEAVKL
ncbi:helicase-exonuclease AddAB subunit AddA [Geosporobacter ferrireducens]|uniref:ATP-dependent helicase/nuclease subunit A n=1 Tax=Geosporobacter ferrireducens TaxID=1424294 RepID=A0A1D8GL88_9FIRM|nr:helicase-exonuclease AddAB subunit AddA [Geosporobacter ferrireducens]AOT71674.1 helicase-exonuclease AddAB subunit AddA [Geosporobacter ferrireducens]